MPDVTKNNFTSNKHPIITTTNFFSIYIWCTAIIVIISVLLHLRIGLNNDTMTLMHQTYKMLAGGKPYVDFVDVNPPLIHYLFTIPLIFSQATGIKLYVALNLFATIIAALSLCVVAGVLRGGGTKKATRTLTISSLALALLSISFMHQLFADREWLLTTLITPLLVLYSPLVTRETVSKRWYVATVLMACIGFCLKPYALTLYAAALLYRPISGQPLHNIFHEKISYIIIIAGMIYALAVWIFAREYIISILPAALQTYGTISWDWGSKYNIIMQQLLGSYALAGLVSTFILVIVAPSFYHRTITYLLLLMVGALGSYALSPGWYYTQYPFMAVAFLLAVTAGGSLLKACRIIPNSLHKNLAMSIVCIGIASALWSAYLAPIKTQLEWDLTLMRDTGRPMYATNMHSASLEKVETHLNIHPRFLFLSFGVWSPNLLNASGKRESIGRFDYLWPLPGILQQKEKPSYNVLAKWFAETLADDITNKKPGVIICDVSSDMYFLPPHYKILEFFTSNEKFAAAWNDYTLADTIDECTQDVQQNCAYQVYYRK